MSKRKKATRRRTSSDSFLTLEDFVAQDDVSANQAFEKSLSKRGVGDFPHEARQLPELSDEIDDSVILWHGTTRSRAKSILRQGFRFEKTMNERGGGLTFFTPSPKVARRYAQTRARAEGDRPAVIMCSIDLSRYNNYERRGAIYVFGHECISREVIRDVEGLPKRQLEKLENREDPSVEFTNVALTFNSGRAGIAYWINSYLKLSDVHRIPEHHESVGKIKQWLDDQVNAGRFGEVPEDEMLEQVRKYLPNTYHSSA
jgi:hypothetical protein